jgi:hypothetical protein
MSTTLKTTLTIVAALLAGGTSLAIAQNGPATGGENPVAGGAAGGGWYPGYGYGYGYAAAPLYNYAAPAYGYAAPAVAPAQAGTTVVIVTPAPAYTAPPVVSGYYNYAPGYWGGYGLGGYGRAGYWWR